MPHYISLMRWTSQGRMGLPAWRDRIEDGEREIEEAGGKLVGVWVTLGRYDVVEAWQLREALETEDAFEERRCAIANRSAGRVVAARLRDEAAVQEVRDRGVGGDAADPGDVRPRARTDVRDDRERLERSLGEIPLGGALEQARARGRLLASGAEGPAAGDVLEHDSAPLLGEAVCY